jgi:hypothetical protein
VLVASNPLLSHMVSGALARAGLERRGEIVRLVMTMRGGDRPKNAHEEFPDVSVMPRSMWEPWLTFRKPIAGRPREQVRGSQSRDQEPENSEHHAGPIEGSRVPRLGAGWLPSAEPPAVVSLLVVSHQVSPLKRLHLRCPRATNNQTLLRTLTGVIDVELLPLLGV